MHYYQGINNNTGDQTCTEFIISNKSITISWYIQHAGDPNKVSLKQGNYNANSLITIQDIEDGAVVSAEIKIDISYNGALNIHSMSSSSALTYAFDPCTLQFNPSFSGPDVVEVDKSYQFTSGLTESDGFTYKWFLNNSDEAITSSQYNSSNIKFGKVPGTATVSYSLEVIGCSTNVVTTTKTVEVIDPVPTQPTNLQVSDLGTKRVKLTWNPSTDNLGVQKYRVYRSVNSGAFDQLAEINANMTQYFDNGLTDGHTYKYRVQAIDENGGLSVSSNEVIYLSIPLHPIRLVILEGYTTEQSRY